MGLFGVVEASEDGVGEVDADLSLPGGSVSNQFEG